MKFLPWAASALPFAVLLLLLVIPYPPARIQIGLEGVDPKLLTGPVVKKGGPAQETLVVKVPGGSLDGGLARLRGSFTLSFRITIVSQIGPSVPAQVEISVPSTRDVFTIWFDQSSRKIWVGERLGQLRWGFRKVLAEYETGVEYRFEVERYREVLRVSLRAPSTNVDHVFEDVSVLKHEVVGVRFSATSLGGKAESRFSEIQVSSPALLDKTAYGFVADLPLRAPEPSSDGWWAKAPMSGLRFSPGHEFVSTTLITSPTAFAASFKVRVLGEAGSVQPFQFGVWDPVSHDTFSVWFSSGGQDVQAGARKIDETWLFTESLGKYELGKSYSFTVTVHRGEQGSIRLVIPELGINRTYTAIPVLRHGMLSLTLGADASKGKSAAVVTDIRMVMPSQPYYTYLAEPDFLFSVVRPGIVLFLLFAVVPAVATALKQRPSAFGWSRLISVLKQGIRLRVLVALLMTALFLQLLMVPIGQHPYDLFTMKAFAYVIRHYGLHALYPLTTALPSGQAVGIDVSLINLVMPYPPLSGYVFGAAGYIFELLSRDFDFSHWLLALLIKIPWILSLEAGGIMIYAFTRRSLLERRRFREAEVLPFVLAAAYIFNPGLNLAAAVWGQFETLTAFLYGLALVAGLAKRPTLAWCALLLALISKQAPIVQAPFVAVLIWQANGLKNSMASLARALGVFGLVLLPWLWVGYTPRFLFNITLGHNVANVLSSRPLGVADWQLSVGTGTYNIWPLVTAYFDRASGFARYTVSLNTRLPSLGLTYGQLGVLIALSLLGFLGLFALWHRRRVFAKEAVFLLVAVALLTVYTWVTNVHERFLGYVFLPLLLSYPIWNRKAAFWLIVGVLTTAYSASIYGTLVLTAQWFPSTASRLLSSRNWLNGIAVHALTDDLVITTFSLASIGMFFTLLAYLIYSVSRLRRDAAIPSPRREEEIQGG